MLSDLGALAVRNSSRVLKCAKKRGVCLPVHIVSENISLVYQSRMQPVAQMAQKGCLAGYSVRAS